MGNISCNILADCKRCSFDQCELCTEILPLRTRTASRHASVASSEGGASAAGQTGGTGNGGASSHPASRLRQASANGILLDDDQALAAAIAASYADGSGGTGGGGLTEEELAAQAIQREKLQEESRQRARLRQEQESEYEESLRIDAEKQIEKEKRRQEEEEEARRLAEEEEVKRLEAEKEADEAAEAASAKKRRIEAIIEEARKHLSPEPANDAAGRVLVVIRTPDGRRLKRAFSASDVVAQLYHFANVAGGEAGDEQAIAGLLYRLVSSMPRHVYEDREATLEAEGLKGQCALLVEIADVDDE